MKTIQIAPYREDCCVENGTKVIGTMSGRTFVFELPHGWTIPDELAPACISNFCEAIALCSKPKQVESLLNDCWGITGEARGRFYEL